MGVEGRLTLTVSTGRRLMSFSGTKVIRGRGPMIQIWELYVVDEGVIKGAY